MTRNLAPKVEMTLLMRIFAIVKPAVRVDLWPGYSILSPPTVNMVRSFSLFWSLISYQDRPGMFTKSVTLSEVAGAGCPECTTRLPREAYGRGKIPGAVAGGLNRTACIL
jgi:hypothetical protein